MGTPPYRNASTFAITTRSGTTTHDPPYPTASNSTTFDNTKRTIEEEGPEDEGTTTTPSKKKPSRLPYTIPLNHPIHVNLPFLEAMIYMAKEAKVLKDFLSYKEKLKKAASLIKLNKECSTVIQRSLPQKEGDLESFTLPCLIRPLAVKNALADLGASINLMPHSIFLRLGIYELKPIRMSIQLADRSVKYPIRVCKNLLVKINKFIFSIDFVILEMDKDELVPIILGRPFLATAHAIIDVHKGKLSLRVRNETVTFNIGKSLRSRYSRDDYLYCSNHTTKLIQDQWVDTVDHDEKWIEIEEEDNPKEN
ncbi:reverse transcriptase domain-containing protein [Tanacetum coccineum]